MSEVNIQSEYDQISPSELHQLTAYSSGTQCGVFATADKRNFMQLQYDLRKVGGNCTVPARSCLRLSCWNTSGIYVCNVSDTLCLSPPRPDRV